MEYDNEIEEGTINIPKAMNISNHNFIERNLKFEHFRQNSLSIYNNKFNSFMLEKDLENKDIVNSSFRMEKYKYNIKNEDNTSTTCKSSNNDSLKKVTFSTVEIIRVANYKKYNKLNSTKKNENEYKDGDDDNICFIF